MIKYLIHLRDTSEPGEGLEIHKLAHDLVSLYKLSEADNTFPGMVNQILAENKFGNQLDRFDLSGADDTNSAVNSVYQFLVAIVYERYKIVNEQRHHNEVLHIFRIRVWRCYRKYKGGNVKVPEHVAQSLKAGSMLLGKFKKSADSNESEQDEQTGAIVGLTNEIRKRNSIGNPHPATVASADADFVEQPENNSNDDLLIKSEKNGENKAPLVSRTSSVMRLLGNLSRSVSRASITEEGGDGSGVLRFLQKSLSRSSLWSNSDLPGDDDVGGKAMDKSETLMSKMLGTISKSLSRSSIKSPELEEFSDIRPETNSASSRLLKDEKHEKIEETAEQRAKRRTVIHDYNTVEDQNNHLRLVP